jgi:predicted trehalose synthase
MAVTSVAVEELHE